VVVVAGVSSGVGKTTVAVGLMHTLTRKGLRVQAFKVGPDFLDGMQHEATTGVPSINLDGWMMKKAGCLAAFHAAVASSAADIAVVEGCMGLHDGRDGCSDDGSTAQVAKWLDAPVLLVVDAWNLARSAAAMVHGYKTFDPAVHIGGVLLNRVAGSSHAEWLRQAMASAPSTATVTVLGCLPSDKHLAVKERLLGLLPPTAAAVRAGSKQTKRRAALERMMREHVDLAALRALAAEASMPLPLSAPVPPQSSHFFRQSASPLPVMPPSVSYITTMPGSCARQAQPSSSFHRSRTATSLRTLTLSTSSVATQSCTRPR
jgi:cobyrinic acid a,c-diamide synthase